MRIPTTLLILIILAPDAVSQYRIAGRVIDADSVGIPLAEVRIPGLDSQPTDSNGYFTFLVPESKRKAYFIKGGVDLFIEVVKPGMVVLDPPGQKIRLPHDPDIQPHFIVVMCKKGSPLLVRSERMLDYILRGKIKAAIEAKEEEFARRDVLAEEATRLGLSKEALVAAIEQYKDRLRTSTDLYKRGLAALDDANEAADYKKREQKLAEAEENFRESLRKDERAVGKGREAESRLPETFYNLGLTLFQETRYDSAIIYFTKADSARPGDADKLNMLGFALYEMAKYSRALQVLGRALEIDTTTHGRNHPKVAIRLNNIAGLLEAQGDYAGALEKYNEALRIFEASFGRIHPQVATALNNIAVVLKAQGDYAGALEKYNEALHIFETLLGTDHPHTRIVRDNRNQLRWESLSEKERWSLRTHHYLSQLKDTSVAKTENKKLALLNQIGVDYIKQAKGDSAVIYLEQALPLAQKLDDKEMIGTILNNLGSGYKTAKNWQQAEYYIRQSIRYNEAVQGDSAAVLAYSYYHFSCIWQIKAQPDSVRYYAEKSQTLAKKHGLNELLEEIRALLSSVKGFLDKR